ncbi:MAG: hypothetical protein ACT4QC_10535 [Planctomycetaceae bacterium]
MTIPNPDSTDNPIARPPLGLPTGSVRALLTLLVLAVVIVQTVRGRTLDELWGETLLIALAHYFTSRRFVGLSPEVLARLESEGHVQKEMNPLYLPRHSIRAIVVLAFAGLAYYEFGIRHVRQFAEVPPVLITVGAYLAGILARLLLGPRAAAAAAPRSRLWEDLKALAVILVMLATAIPYFLDRGDLVPPQGRSLALALVLFYFGSR